MSCFKGLSILPQIPLLVGMKRTCVAAISHVLEPVSMKQAMTEQEAQGSTWIF